MCAGLLQIGRATLRVRHRHNNGQLQQEAKERSTYGEGCAGACCRRHEAAWGCSMSLQQQMQQQPGKYTDYRIAR